MALITVYDLVLFTIGRWSRLGSLPSVSYLDITFAPQGFNPNSWFTSKLLDWGTTSLPISFVDSSSGLIVQTYNIVSVTNNTASNCIISVTPPASFLPSLVGTYAVLSQSSPRQYDNTPAVTQPDLSFFSNNATSTASAQQLQQAISNAISN